MAAIRKALLELHDYVAKKSAETRTTLRLLHQHPELNHRQEVILTHELRNPNHAYSIAAHQSYQGIAYATARVDLFGLADSGLLERRKKGNAFYFVSPVDLEKRLKSK